MHLSLINCFSHLSQFQCILQSICERLSNARKPFIVLNMGHYLRSYGPDWDLSQMKGDCSRSIMRGPGTQESIKWQESGSEPSEQKTNFSFVPLLMSVSPKFNYKPNQIKSSSFIPFSFNLKILMF